MQFLSETGSFLSDSSAALPRVLQLLDDEDGIAAKSVVSIAQGLSATGGDTVVAGGPGRAEPMFRRAGLDHRPYRADRAGFFQSNATQALLDTVHQRALSLIHVHGTALGLAAKSVADLTGLPLVMSCDDLPKAQGFLGRRIARKHFTGRPIVVPSDYAALCLRRDFGLPETSVRVVAPGIDPTDLDENAVTSERTIALALTWGIADDARDVFLVPNAGADPAWLSRIVAAATSGDSPDAVWILVGRSGEADAEQTVLDRLMKAGAADRIRWVPKCTDWPAAYKLASLVLDIPATRVAVHRHALEAQAMGRAVVVSDTGAGGEALSPGKTGWIIRDRDAGSLSYAVSAAMSRDPIIRDAMAMSARNFIATRFSPRAMRSAITGIYREALLPGI